MADHAKLSPSSAHRWMACPGSVALESTQPDTSSASATEGTLAHALAAVCLEDEHDAALFVGNVFKYTDHGVDREAIITGEMATNVQVYIDAIRSYARDGEMFIEQRLPFFGADDLDPVQASVVPLTDVPEQFGTSDAVILQPKEIQIHDLKYGRGVKVDAFEVDENGESVPNPQMALYALGALAEYSLTHDFNRVRLVIHQPRLGHLSEFGMSVDDLRAFGRKAKAAARVALVIVDTKGPFLHPGESQCRFCKAQAVCPALRNVVLSTVADDFADISVPIADQVADVNEQVADNAMLGRLLAAVPMIESWCKAIGAKAHAELLAGNPVDGFKLVQGRQGARAWTSADEAEALLKAMRLKADEMYDRTVINPTACEKVLADSPRKWAKVQPLISRSDGKPSVAPATDKRPALVIEPVATADDFDNIDDASDLV